MNMLFWQYVAMDAHPRPIPSRATRTGSVITVPGTANVEMAL